MELNINLEAIIQNVKLTELNVSITTVFLNAQIFKIIFVL